MELETNIFPITNLKDLSSNYKLFRIKGLQPEQSEYYQNCQILTRRLSYLLRKPVIIIERERTPYLVLRDDAVDPPSPFPLVRQAPIFERVEGTFKLDYAVRTPENDAICLRFLQFVIQEPLHSNRELWQPGAGQPFFEKESSGAMRDVVQYRGFTVRTVVTPSGGLGLCVDATSKSVCIKPLPEKMSRDEIVRWKDKHCIYRYGHRWYEVQISGLDDRNVTEYLIQKSDRWISLLEYTVEECEKPIPLDLAQVSHDASVVIYKDNQARDRGAVASLCYPVFGTHEQEAGSQHKKTILPPFMRRRNIHDFVSRYLLHLRFGDTRIQISQSPVSLTPHVFAVPDFKFGHSHTLSVRGSSGTQNVSLDNLGVTRLALLKNKEAGFHSSEPLDRQYFIMPQSVFESYGTRFLSDLCHTVDEFFPQQDGYKPILVTYNDRVPKAFVHQGKAVLDAVDAECKKPGYGVVMIHHTIDRQIREEDQLAAMVTRELRRYDLCVSIIHSTMGQECYELVSREGSKPSYKPRENKRSALAGYLRGVALNKVLLTNQRWPFVLATPLNADITIGIDVKHNTAGLVIVGKNGGEIRTLFKTSRQKERLLDEQLRTYLVEILRQEAEVRSEPIKTITIHRDGRVYRSELVGAREAVETLKREGSVDPNSTLTVVEIPKSSPAPLRLFDVTDRNGRSWIENPQIGTQYLVNESEGYICSTGRAFPRPGTVNPLHIRRVEGPMSLEKCLEDVYYLTALAWTRPEDCTRHPITIKLNDRFLGEEASEYDSDALEFAGTPVEEAIA